MYATLFYKFQKLSLEIFCIFFCPFLNCLQERERGNILSFLLNHHTPSIPSKFPSYKFGHFSFSDDKIIWALEPISWSFYIIYTITTCLRRFRKSQFQSSVYVCVSLCVYVCVFKRQTPNINGLTQINKDLFVSHVIFQSELGSEE